MRISRREAEEARARPQVRAFLHVLRHGESSHDERAFKMRWGGLGKPVAYFDDFSRHPRIFEPTTGGRQSSAAGAFQITATTYDDFAPGLGITGFTPEEQELLAIAIIAAEDALADILEERVEAAISKLSRRWTSLPGAEENNPRWTIERAVAFFQARLAEERAAQVQEPAPIEDHSAPARPEDIERITNDPEQEPPMPAPMLLALAPLLGTLAQSLISIFTPLAQEKIAGAVNKATKTGDKTVGDQVAKVVLEAAHQVVAPLLPPDKRGKALTEENVIEVVAAARANPAAIAEAEKAAIDYLDTLAPFIDKFIVHENKMFQDEEASRTAAAQRAMASGEDMAKPLLRVTLGLIVAITVFMGAAIVAQFAQGKTVSTELWASFTGLAGWIMAKAGTIFDYRFGTSRQSNVQQAFMNEAFTKRR